VPKPAPAPEAARAKALLEGKAVADAKPTPALARTDPAREGGRFVVQVGAFADAAAAREMRAKVEKLGLKSYTQVVETSSGNRTRVRAGPFDSRDEAEKALAKAKAAGLNAVVLTL
jgi:DedD protein